MNTNIKTTIDNLLHDSARDLGLRRRIAEVLGPCPSTGNGVHRYLFIAALKLHRHCPDKNELARLLAEATADCGREVPDEEIENAIINSQPIAEGTARGTTRRPRWPERNDKLIEGVVKDGPTLDGLAAMSPVRLNNDQPYTEAIIDALFPGNPLLCAGAKKERALTRTREEWRGFAANQQFIVPSPMSAARGKTKSGKSSTRCLANTGPRRFLVIEFDQAAFDQQAALLVHLATFAPLVLVVHSGNKSLQGWFQCAEEPGEKIERFFRYAVSVGADPATWTRCQFVRMPDGERDNGKRQRVILFNPRPVEGR